MNNINIIVNIIIVILLIYFFYQIPNNFINTHVTNKPLVFGPKYLKDTENNLILNSEVLENKQNSKDYSYNLWLFVLNDFGSLLKDNDKLIFVHKDNGSSETFSLLYNQKTSSLKYKMNNKIFNVETEIPQRKWTNISINFQGKIMDIYINGKLENSLVLDFYPKTPSGPILLSSKECSDSNKKYNESGIPGYIDIFRYTNEYLDPDRVESIYNSENPVGEKSPSDNIFWWTG